MNELASERWSVTRALHAEWTKLRTVPSTVWSVLSMAAGTVAVGVFAIMGLGPEKAVDPARLGLSGVYLGQVAAVALAVLAVSPEYDTGMIRTTLTADPLRARVLSAKAAVVTAIVLLTGTVTVLGLLVIARIMLPDKGFPAPSITDGPMLRAHAGTVLYFGLIALLSIGTALVVRHTAATITVVLSALYTLPIVAMLVTDPVWRERILRLAPMTAGLAIQATRDLDLQPIKPWPGLAVLAGYAAVTLVLGAVSFHTRDAN